MSTVLVLMAAYLWGVFLLIAGVALAFNLGGAADRAATWSAGTGLLLDVWRRRLHGAAEHAWYWRVTGVAFRVIAVGIGFVLVLLTRAR
jgi:hypothetical protein